MKNKLLGNSVIFIGMTFIQKGMAFLLLPLYTKILSPNEYGIVSLVTSIYAIYILIFSIALDDAVARYYFKYKSDKEKKKVVLGTFTLIALATSIIGTIILVIASSLFLEPFAQKIDFFPYMILGLVPVGCSSVYSIVKKSRSHLLRILNHGAKFIHGKYSAVFC
jgi:O-antigen/teichoic acid export membrane protein